MQALGRNITVLLGPGRNIAVLTGQDRKLLVDAEVVSARPNEHYGGSRQHQCGPHQTTHQHALALRSHRRQRLVAPGWRKHFCSREYPQTSQNRCRFVYSLSFLMVVCAASNLLESRINSNLSLLYASEQVSSAVSIRACRYALSHANWADVRWTLSSSLRCMQTQRAYRRISQETRDYGVTDWPEEPRFDGLYRWETPNASGRRRDGRCPKGSGIVHVVGIFLRHMPSGRLKKADVGGRA